MNQITSVKKIGNDEKIGSVYASDIVMNRLCSEPYIMKHSKPKKYSNLSYKLKLLPNLIITFICKLLYNLFKNGVF